MDEAKSRIETPEQLYSGYVHGAFPMADTCGELHWYAPYKRALFPITGIHVSRSLDKTIRQRRFEITLNQAFEQVMRGCLRPDDNWISEQMIELYCSVHREGWAHSCEVWQAHELVGGIYGLQIGSCFCAESMFHRQTDASKVALWAMVQSCLEAGYEVFDAQVMNPHLARLGAFSIPQDEFVSLLQSGLGVIPKPLKLPSGY